MKIKQIWVAVVTLETVTPLTIGTGRGDDLRDSVCVSDANGLPTIPGSSLAGALRARWGGSGEQDSLFGYQRRDDGRRSRITVGWASIHDRQDRPVPFRRDDAQEDDILSFLAAGVTRDHVRISAQGVADGSGKFDETLVPRGARFSVELRIDNPEQDEPKKLLEQLSSPALRLGGRTRRGYGRIRIVRAHARLFNIPADQADWGRWASLPDLAERQRTLPKQPPAQGAAPSGYKPYNFTLVAEDHWLVSGGEPTVNDKLPGKEKVADMIPVRERAVTWDGQGRATISGPLAAYMPGSSLKGVLRHRTAYHLRCLDGAWAEGEAEVEPDERSSSEPDGLELLFGRARGREDRLEDEQTPDNRAAKSDIAGRVFIADVVATPHADHGTVFQNHVAIDRFSGAPLAGCLFSEAPLWRPKLAVEVLVQTPDWGDPARAQRFRRVLDAFELALRDLKRGRLAIGGGGNRGHGYFLAEGA